MKKICSQGPERLGHRNLDHLRAGKRKPPRPDLPNEEGRPVERINTPKGPPAFPQKGEIRCLLLTETSDLMVKSSAYLSDLIRFPIA